MDEKKYLKAAEKVIYLSGCAVNGVTPSLEKISNVPLEEIYFAARNHMLTSITAFALETAGLKHEKFSQSKARTIKKLLTLEMESEKIFERLELSAIWYMPLKGCVMKEYYPRFFMREMSDCDILFDASRADDVKNIMKSLGFTVKSFKKHCHDIYYKNPVSNFEMHRKLFLASHDKKISEYYSDIKSKLIKKNYRYNFTHEDFYVYLTAHEHKHFSVRGTGLRSLLDVYVFIKKFGGVLDWDYISREIVKLGISDFEKENRSLALALFSHENFGALNYEMMRYFIFSGAGGTDENSAHNRVKKYGRAGYFFMRVIPPLYIMREEYPILEDLPLLYPLCLLHKWTHEIIFKRKKVFCHLKAIIKK